MRNFFVLSPSLFLASQYTCSSFPSPTISDPSLSQTIAQLTDYILIVILLSKFEISLEKNNIPLL